MHIEFRPRIEGPYAERASTAYGYHGMRFSDELQRWSETYNIPVYNISRLKNVYKLKFEREEHYTMFILTWNSHVEDSPYEWWKEPMVIT